MASLASNFDWLFIVISGVLLLLIVAIVVWSMLRANARQESLLREVKEEVKRYQTNVDLLSQSMENLGQHFSSNLANLQETQRQLNLQILRLGENLTQIERSLTLKIIDGDRRSKESLQNLREETFRSFAKLQENILQIFQSIQQNSSNEIHTLQKTLLVNLGQLREQVSILYAQAKERKDLERQTAESIRRLEAILAGTQSKGAAGERIVEQVFAKLPAEWRIRNFRINGKVVEFGLRLPNGLVLPIDSKWPSSELIEKFAQTDNPEEQIILKREIEKAVLRKAQEARKYIDPSQTLPFAVIVVPDAVFDLSMGIHAELVQIGVAILSYSIFIPYLLLVFHTIMKTSLSFDVQSLINHLDNVNQSLNNIQEEIEGRFSRALTMLNNSRDALRTHLQRANASLMALEATTEKEFAE